MAKNINGVRKAANLESALSLSLFLTVCFAHLSIFITGQINLIHAAVSLTAVTGGQIFSKKLQELSSWIWNTIILTVFAACLTLALMPPRGFESYFSGLAYLVIYITTIRFCTRKTARDNSLILLLALLEVCAASIFTISISFLFTLTICTCAVISTLMLLAMKEEISKENITDEDKTSGTVSPKRTELSYRFFFFSFSSTFVIFIIGVLVFFMVPRVGRSFLSWRSGLIDRVSGFSDTVELGSLGAMKQDNSLVMRVRFENDDRLQHPLYMRGNAHDHYDGRVWRDTIGPRKIYYYTYQETVNLKKVGSLSSVVKQEVILEPIDSPVLFGTPEIIAVAAPFKFKGIVQNYNGYISLPLDSPIYDRLFYTVWSYPTPSTRDECEAIFSQDTEEPYTWLNHKYLQVPDNNEDVSKLALEITRDLDTSCQKAFAIRNYLSDNYTYDLETPSDRAKYPMKHFLFESKTGYCEHFATSMTIMLRSIGIKSRLGAGYNGGEYNDIDDYYQFRQKDAHVWVEMSLPNGQWMIIEPTPAISPEKRFPDWMKPAVDLFDAVLFRWDRWIVDLTLRDQYNLSVKLKQQGMNTTNQIARAPTTLLPRIIAAAKSPFFWVMALLGAGIYFFWVRIDSGKTKSENKKQQNMEHAINEYRKLLKTIEKKGHKRNQPETLTEFSNRLEKMTLPFARAFAKATKYYLEIRFGKKPPTQKALEEFEKAKKIVK
jgi:protein-glutamine gamma-glutamyltransferase